MPDPRIWPIPNVTDNYVTVLAVSTLVLAANPNRVDAEFVNDGDEVIYLSRGNAAVIGQGMRINPRGGSYRIGTNNLFKGDIYGICAGASNMTFSEGVQP